MEVGAQRARRITFARNDLVDMAWVMSDAEFAAFRAWWNDEAWSIAGDSESLAAWSFTNATLAKVTGIKPRGLYEVAIEAVTEDPSVHTADLGITAAPIVTSSLPRVITLPVVGGLMARRIPGDNSRAVLAWRPAVGAESYQIEMASGIDPNDPNVTWTRTADTSASNFVLTLFFAAQTLIRVRGIGLAAGPWVAAALGSLIPDMWNTDATPMWTTNANPMWSS